MTHSLIRLSTIILAVAASGCQSSKIVRDPEYAVVMRAHNASFQLPAEELTAPVIPDLEGPHFVEDYIGFALSQNPQIHSARKRVEAAALKVPVVSSLQDPTVSMTVLPEQVQTAAGQQEFILAANQKVPWRGKLSTRAAAAEAQANALRANLASVELKVIADVKRSYYELFFLQSSIDVTEAELVPLNEIREVANSRYIVGQASQQDVLRADLEIANVTNELIRLRQQLTSQQARLAKLLHVAPQSNLLAVPELGDVNMLADLASLQEMAVIARPELHAKLALLERDRFNADLTRLDYYPDVTVGATWIDVATAGISPVANGRDSFLLTAGINLPIYQKRLDAATRSSEATLVSTAREYDSIRDETLESVADLFAKANSQAELIALFEQDILPTARQTLEVSLNAYDVGTVDFLQLVDNWRQLLRYEISHLRLEASLRQTVAELEQIVGGLNIYATEPLDGLPLQPQNQ